MRPIDRVYQVAYIVDDLEAAALRWIGEGGAGPFTIFRHFKLIEPRTAEGLAVPDFSFALGFSGVVNIELIQVHSYGPSVYNLPGFGRPPYPHHVARLTNDIEATVARYEKIGCPLLLGGGFEPKSSLAYMDTRNRLGCITEFIQVNPQVVEILNGLEAQAASWDGKDPLREFGG